MSMTNVEVVRFSEDEQLNPDALLESLKGQLEGFVLAGYDKNGVEYFVSTYADGEPAVWLLERCKRAVLSGEDV